jgi:NAD(P)-dependent dehydrogenase (short-subunit alcohol dehydrogenase family)
MGELALKVVTADLRYLLTTSAVFFKFAKREDAKARIAVFTKSLALEVVRDGVNVNAIAPGRVGTERVRSHYTDAEWAEKAAAIPMKRWAMPDEIAPTALFLVRDENQYITGQTIHVNGAWLNW